MAEIPIPVAGEDELLIRTEASTICTSDLIDIRSNPDRIPLPIVIGHEASGTVASVGSGTSGFQPGDRVATHPVHPCGRCRACREGLEHLCESMGHFGYNRPGTFAEFYTVRQDRARRIPAGLDAALASLAEPVAVCLEALQRARLKRGDRLLIMGDGPFGILISRLARDFGLGKTVVAGCFDSRLAFADGADTVNVRRQADVPSALLQAGGGGFEAAIVAVASADAFRNALGVLRPRGRLVLFAVPPGDIPINFTRLHLKELEILGSCNDPNLFDRAVQILAQPSCPLSDLITHRFSVDRYREALAQAGEKLEATMKVAFLFPAAGGIPGETHEDH